MKTHAHPNPQSAADPAQSDAALPRVSSPGGFLSRIAGSIRPVALVLTASFLGACASPYTSQMALLD